MEKTIADGELLHSVYRGEADEDCWIMTEWEWSITTILMPSDY